MKPTRLKTDCSCPPSLKIIRGLKGRSMDFKSLVDSAWNLCHTALWPSSVFSFKEIEFAKQLIATYLLARESQERSYMALCQRVLIAREHLGAAIQVEPPSRWLHPGNSECFAMTNAWYHQVEQMRQSLPLYKIELKAFAEATLEMAQEPTSSNFTYWKSYFIQGAKDSDLLSLFLCTIANQYYQNR